MAGTCAKKSGRIDAKKSVDGVTIGKMTTGRVPIRKYDQVNQDLRKVGASLELAEERQTVGRAKKII